MQVRSKLRKNNVVTMQILRNLSQRNSFTKYLHLKNYVKKCFHSNLQITYILRK